MIIQFTIDGVTVSQNKLDGAHWSVKHAQRTLWHQAVAYTIGRARKPCDSKAAVSVVRVSKRLIDPLNVYAGLKWIVDALVELGSLRGDTYEDMTIRVDQRKCAKDEKPHMSIMIDYE